MDFEDKVAVATPEGVELELGLAGVGSRLAAGALDLLIQITSLYLVPFVLAFFVGAGSQVTGGSGDEAIFLLQALFFIWAFLVIFGYDVAFETLGGGRTPGKRALGIRVIRTGGHPIGFLASVVRNLLRVVDFLPMLYGVGIIFVLATGKNQRLGDIAAGTLVVRDRKAAEPARSLAASAYAIHPPPDPEAATWDVSAITQEEVAAIRSFLERRWGFTQEARARLAWELSERIRPKVAGHSGDQHPELFLERVVNAKAVRS